MRSVTIDRAGLQLDGRPFYLLSGCIHYFRWPRAEWRSLLEQARWAGLNTIDTVIPWNRHEPQPGQFDFTAEADLAAYLDLCNELGLKAIVRPGPYICAEWENGGLPAWLTAEPGIRLRVDDPRYIGAIERWFDRLMAIIAPRQHQHGGAVILCQIENEHWASGFYAHDTHQHSLADAATARGIVVPQYTCMGAMPGQPEFRNGWSGIAEKLVQSRALWPEMPMIVSELWSGWFDQWGGNHDARKSPAKLDITLHQLTAVGAAGFSHWMWAGGTNFAHWGGRTVGGDLVFMTASYDYDAPVSEYGELRSKALVARRHHLFLGSFGPQLAPVLADAIAGGMRVIGPPVVRGRSEAAAAPYRTVRAAPNAPVNWCDFQATFLYNPTLEGATYQIFLEQPRQHLRVEVEPATIRPIFAQLPLGDEGVRLSYHTGRILGFWTAGHAFTADHDLLVIYGQPGEQGRLGLAFPDQPIQLDAEHDPSLQLRIEGNNLHLGYWLKERGSSITLRCAARTLQLQLLPQQLADQFGAAPPSVPAATDLKLLSLPAKRHTSSESVATDGWQPITQPIAMDHLECAYGYGWYRAELELTAPLSTHLAAPWLSDRARLLVNGTDVGWLGLGPDAPHFTLPLELPAGRHELRLLADNLGRFNYGLKLGELKGLLDTLYLDGEVTDLSTGWSALWQEVQFAGEAVARAYPGAFRPDLAEVDLGQFAFEGPAIWLLRLFDTCPGRRYVIQFTGDGDRSSGALFVNGEAVERFSRHRSGGMIKADITDLVRPGANLLALNLQGYAGAPWKATLLSYDPERPLPATWSFRPSVTPGSPTQGTTAPAFYQLSFNRADLPTKLAQLGLRVGALVKGQIWLNGQNVARFWQIGPQEQYKLPISWLEEQNRLLIFAEEGHTASVALCYRSSE